MESIRRKIKTADRAISNVKDFARGLGKGPSPRSTVLPAPPQGSAGSRRVGNPQTAGHSGCTPAEPYPPSDKFTFDEKKLLKKTLVAIFPVDKPHTRILRTKSDVLRSQIHAPEGQPKAEADAVLREEVERLRNDLSELHKLRGEVALLRRENADLRKEPNSNLNLKPSAEPAQPSDTAQPLDSKGAEPFRTRINARVNFGESLATGGWETEPGRRLVVFLRPSLKQSDEGAEEIAMQPLGVELPESLLAKYGLDALMVDSRRTSQNGLIFPGTDVESIMHQLAKEPGTRPVVLPEQQQTPGKSMNQFAKGRDGAIVHSQSNVDLAPDGTGFDLHLDWAVPANAIHKSAP